MADVKFYKCTKCANLFVKVLEGPCTPECCGEPCTELVAGSTDGAREKHVPAVTREGGKIIAKVGEVAHPMLDEHFIQFVALATDDRIEIKKLQPGEAPEATFACDGAQNATGRGRPPECAGSESERTINGTGAKIYPGRG